MRCICYSCNVMVILGIALVVVCSVLFLTSGTDDMFCYIVSCYFATPFFCFIATDTDWSKCYLSSYFWLICKRFALDVTIRWVILLVARYFTFVYPRTWKCAFYLMGDSVAIVCFSFTGYRQ